MRFDSQAGQIKRSVASGSPPQEMGIYRDNLSAIVIGDNLLPIIVIAENGFDLPITDIAFVIYFVVTDKLLR